MRPDAPGAAIGFVNLIAAVTILVGTPLLGLTFSLPGDGRIGFAIVAALVALTPLARQSASNSVRSAFWTCRRFSASSQIADRLP